MLDVNYNKCAAVVVHAGTGRKKQVSNYRIIRAVRLLLGDTARLSQTDDAKKARKYIYCACMGDFIKKWEPTVKHHQRWYFNR